MASRPRVLVARGNFWEPVWREGLYEPDVGLPDDSPRVVASRIVYAPDETNVRRGVFYQCPLGRTYIDPWTFEAVRRSVYEAEDRFYWLPSSVRREADNSVLGFLHLYATPEGRARLMRAGLSLHDDDGERVNARGDLILEAAKRADQSDYEYWLGDQEREPVPFNVETHPNPPVDREETLYEPRPASECATRKRG